MNNLNVPPEDAGADSPRKLSAPADTPERASEAEHSTEQTDRISARAHFKSQHRSVSEPGSADNDWLEAEREIDSATKGDRR